MTSAAALLQDHGQIKRMRLPDGWEGRQVDLGEFDQRTMLEFTAPGHPDVRLSFFYRGVPVDEYSGEAFREVLDQPEHTLSPEELEDIADVLDNLAMPETFLLETANTMEVAGKKVLAVAGTWLASENKTWAIFIDADGTGSVIQEIHFLAHSDRYNAFVDEAWKAFESIEWK